MDSPAIFTLCRLRVTQAKEAERKAMIEGIQANGAGSSERVIQRVLEKRQAEVIGSIELFTKVVLLNRDPTSETD